MQAPGVWRAWCQGSALAGFGSPCPLAVVTEKDLDRPCQGLPMIKDAEAWDVYDNLVHIKVSDGKSTLFWRDRWING